ncbi:hypothetical protein B5D80_15350 [Micromonospora wenchangensis]|uniref:Uncharacterized protein n=1 Tax=Micromonospora wenchangensis TaxID=1185415 RepID=A0A246RLL7_9ACTN|nr:hypothetical protein B5D80_15350 [Micromonospora wenchangensis]
MRMHACLPVGGLVGTSMRRICRPVPRSPAGPAGSPGCPCGQLDRIRFGTHPGTVDVTSGPGPDAYAEGMGTR